MTKEKIKNKYTYKQLLTVAIGLIGVIGSLASIYALLSSQRQVSLQCDIVSSTNVLDINTEISDLDILFKQSSLKDRNKNLKLVIFSVKNNGTEDILKTFYDDKAPFGINPLVGEIVEKPEIIEASNDYLNKNLDIKLDSTGIAYFSDVIIDASEQFTFKLLTLVDIGTEPKFEIIGKIAGINDKIQIGRFELEVELPFFRQVFLGDVWVQVVKGIIYFLIIVILIIIVAASTEKNSEKRKKKKRLKKIEEFKSLEKYNFKHIDSAIFELYKKEREDRLLSIQEDLKDVNLVKSKYVELKDKLNKEKEESDKRKGYTEEYYDIKDDIEAIDELINSGFIIQNNGDFIINEQMSETLNQFIKYCGITETNHRYYPVKMLRNETITAANTV
jgi:hypothetical protein